MRRLIFLSLLTLLFCSNEYYAAFETEMFRLSLNSSGRVTGLIDKSANKNYLASKESAPLLAIRVKNEIELPKNLSFETATNYLTLLFPKNNIEAVIRVEEKQTHINFELLSLSSKDSVKLVIWGPYPTTIGKIVGETVGVVRDDKFAIGIQALNLKTLGGYPPHESDIDPQCDIFSTSNYIDVADSLKILYRGQTAKKTDFGGVVGSKIALFGCPPEKALETIGGIELAEGLPHPMLDGQWGKVAPGATAAYLIMNFGEKNLDEAVALTKKAGLRYLYHGGPFENWGHFKLNEKEFPDNRASLKRCADRAEKQGVRIGLHTLSNFITTNDPYVTPVPDDRLAKVGFSKLAQDLGKETADIAMENPMFFNQTAHSHGKKSNII